MINMKSMSLFDDMLKDDESLFMEPVVLDYDYLPKLIPFREKEQKHIAQCIKPLFANRNGKNILLHGPPGIGKTAAIRHILRELEDTTDDVIPIYINTWQKNTTFPSRSFLSWSIGGRKRLSINALLMKTLIRPGG